MNSGLLKRVAKLEARRNGNKEIKLPRLVFSRADIPPELITGFRADAHAAVMRGDGELLNALEDRAWGEIGGHHLFAVYGGAEGE